MDFGTRYGIFNSGIPHDNAVAAETIVLAIKTEKGLLVGKEEVALFRQPRGILRPPPERAMLNMTKSINALLDVYALVRNGNLEQGLLLSQLTGRVFKEKDRFAELCMKLDPGMDMETLRGHAASLKYRCQEIYPRSSWDGHKSGRRRLKAICRHGRYEDIGYLTAQISLGEELYLDGAGGDVPEEVLTEKARVKIFQGKDEESIKEEYLAASVAQKSICLGALVSPSPRQEHRAQKGILKLALSTLKQMEILEEDIQDRTLAVAQ